MAKQMTITVEISPQVQAELARQAEAHGRAIEAYVATLIEDAIRPSAASNSSSEHFMRVDRLEKALREIAEFSHKIPALPDEAFTREGLYRDHD